MKRPRIPSQLSESVHHRLNMYALAASAAGVGLLALAHPSEAEIVYTKTHQVIGTNCVYPLDLNHDGIIDFLIQERGYSTASASNGLWVDQAFGNAVEATNYHAAALKEGALIGPRERFQHINDVYGELMAGHFCGTEAPCSTSGQWVNVKNRYLGLKFRITGKIHYGWARLSVKLQGSKITATLTGYAYETTPNKAIHAGQTHGPVHEALTRPDTGTQAIPAAGSVTQVSLIGQSASLGKLAQGNAVLLWRRP